MGKIKYHNIEKIFKIEMKVLWICGPTVFFYCEPFVCIRA